MRFGRKPATRPSLYPSFGGTFDVEGYIHYHGAAIVRRFDANSHLYLTRAMDLYDVGAQRRRGVLAAPDRRADESCSASASDWLFPPDEIEALAVRAEQAGVHVSYAESSRPTVMMPF